MCPADLLTLRRRLSLTQAQLASRLGVNRSTLYRWETGRCRIPVSATLVVTAWMEEVGRSEMAEEK